MEVLITKPRSLKLWIGFKVLVITEVVERMQKVLHFTTIIAQKNLSALVVEKIHGISLIFVGSVEKKIASTTLSVMFAVIISTQRD